MRKFRVFMAINSVMALQEKEMKLLTSNQPMVQGKKNPGWVWYGPYRMGLIWVQLGPGNCFGLGL